MLSGGGAELGRDYPRPVVDLDAGRARALAAFDAIKAIGREARRGHPASRHPHTAMINMPLIEDGADGGTGEPGAPDLSG